MNEEIIYRFGVPIEWWDDPLLDVDELLFALIDLYVKQEYGVLPRQSSIQWEPWHQAGLWIAKIRFRVLVEETV